MLSCGNAEKSAKDKKEQGATPPNLVLILADDLGYADVGFNGSKEISTPNIDRIAKEGTVFTNGYVTWAACGPSRAGIITGRYQGRFGFSRNPLFTPNDPEMGLPLSEETLADVLKKANYKSAILGKWHLGAHSSLHPLNRGFDDFYGFLSGGHHYFPEKWTLADEFEAKSQYDGYSTKLLKNHKRVEETEYLTDALSREAVNYIHSYKEQPFFIYLAYNAPHTPLQATEKYLDRYAHIEDPKRRTYAAMVSAVDDGVGNVLDALNQLGLSENTLVVFLSDNGGPEPHNKSDNGVLRGTKGQLFEGGIRVPFAMKWPKKIPAGVTYDYPVISLDIFSTIIAQVKTPIITKNTLDGTNLIPYLTGEKKEAPHNMLYWRIFDKGEFAIRAGHQKLIQTDSTTMIFNLDKDISEERPIAHKSDSLTTEYTTWKEQLKDPVFLGLRQNKEYDELHTDRFTKKENQPNN